MVVAAPGVLSGTALDPRKWRGGDFEQDLPENDGSNVSTLLLLVPAM